MANHGGKREGAGKPKGYKAPHTILVAEARKLLIDAYIEKQDKIDAALLAKAEMGDVPAIKEVYDRVYGKSLQTNENINVKKFSISDEQYDQLLTTATTRKAVSRVSKKGIS